MRIAVLAAAAALFATAAQSQQYSADQIFKAWDKNNDAGITEEEFVAAGRPAENFSRLDLDKDGKITLEELQKIFAARQRQGG